MLYLSLEGTDYMEVVPFQDLLRPTPFSDQLLSYRPLIQCLFPVYQLFFMVSMRKQDMYITFA